MSDFLIYAARLQDAGVHRLVVRIWTAKDRTRMMRIAPDGNYPQEVQARWPWRDFELCGTDRVLERIKDDMLYGEQMTPERLQVEIDAHPLQADDLREWFADWLLASNEEPTEEELAAIEATIDPADTQRSVDRIKNMIRGIDIARRRDAMQQDASKRSAGSEGV